MLFTIGAFYGRDGFAAMLVSGFVAKFAAATFYSILVAGYARWLDTPQPRSSAELTGSGRLSVADLPAALRASPDA